MQNFVELPSLPVRKPLQDPELRNGLKNRRLLPQTELKDSQILTWSQIQGNPTESAAFLAAIANLQTSLGFIPLRPSNNLSELTDNEVAIVNLGIPSYFLQLIGGTLQGTLQLSANVPLRFQGGILPSPQTGVMDYDGHQIYFTPSSTRKALVQATGVIEVSEVVEDDTAETEIFTTTIEANAPGVGQLLKLLFYGRYSTANGVDTVTIRFKVAGSTVLSFVTTAAAVTNAPLFAEFVTTIRTTGATGTFWSYLQAVANQINKHATVNAETAIDTTGEVEFSITAQWSAADPGNILSLDQALLVTD